MSATTDKFVVWEVERVNYLDEDARLRALLADGWEPFAVTGSFLWLRRWRWNDQKDKS